MPRNYYIPQPGCAWHIIFGSIFPEHPNSPNTIHISHHHTKNASAFVASPRAGLIGFIKFDRHYTSVSVETTPQVQGYPWQVLQAGMIFP
jgi:hypothetical protein